MQHSVLAALNSDPDQPYPKRLTLHDILKESDFVLEIRGNKQCLWKGMLLFVGITNT
jgi:hypothetical protein